MSGFLIARSKRAALAATFLIPFAGGAFAQSADGRSTADIEKENAALRAKVHRLEAEKENIGLRAKVDQLQVRRSVQAATTNGAPSSYPLVTRIETNAPDRTLVMADMPMKAAAPPIPYYSWTGFYLGGNIGYGAATNHAQGIAVTPTGTATSMMDFAVTPAGGIGGVQVGYNWQGGSNWLAGFEADFQGSSQKTTNCILNCLSIVGPTAVTEVFSVSQTLDYFGTIRGRLGVVDGGNLFYVTGGGAYGHVNQQVAVNFAVPTALPPASFAGGTSSTDNKFGWVIGAGFESSLGSNWTAKIEYLYMNLGSAQTTFSSNAIPATLLGGSLNLTATSSLHDNIVRAGLNYRFGAPAGPVSAYDAMAAVPPPVFSWTGFYVGANAGYGFANDLHHTIIDDSPAFGTGGPDTSVTPRGGVGGVQIGYNWQPSPHWLAGFEADLQGTTQSDKVCAAALCESSVSNFNAVSVQQQIDYFGTVRGRLGFVHNNALFYGTAGAAFGHVRDTVHLDELSGGTSTSTEHGTTKDLTGYVVGGGIESMLWNGWSAKAEYLFMNLGSISNTLVDPSGFGAVSTNSTVRDHIVRLGVNYHFGAAPY